MLFDRIFLSVILLLMGISSTAVAETECSPSEFQCQSGQCVDMVWKCDGSAECDDGSDELGCPSSTCTDSSFQCDNGQCIPVKWRCDGAVDCRDESDEKEELCNAQACEGFKCEKSRRCLPNDWKCDGTDDCDDGSDEKNCSKSHCGDHEFTCANKECISKTWRCDMHPDCTDESDEKGCVESACKEDEFTCTNGNCITDMWRCDGDDDCKDRSDETNCTQPGLGTCEPEEFRCLTPTSEVECIHLSWKCDGDEDCADGSDEGCKGRTCGPDEVMCKDDKYCIKKFLLCDGQFDCQDDSDEMNCTEPELTCEENKFDCFNNGSFCISKGAVCNGRPDCPNLADEATELNCPVKNICQTQKGGCDHICIVSTTKQDQRTCSCFDGYELEQGSETKCKDIDECDLPETCSQHCVNTVGSYKCECQTGYALVKKHLCKATVGQPVELFLSDTHDLRRYRLDTYHYTLLVDSSPSGAKAMDFDIRDETVYWIGTGSKSIFRTKLQSGKIEEIHSVEESDPSSIAVDWANQNLYVADDGHDVISVSKLNGTHRHTLVSGDIDQPRALVLDPYNGWMYWTDVGHTPKIEKCGMDGKHRTVIRKDDIVWPNGLTIDYVKNRLYWADAKMHTITSTDLNGNAHKVIYNSPRHLGHPHSITVFEDFLYWSDWIDNAVHKTNKFGNGDITTVAPDLKTPYDVMIYHIYRQPIAQRACEGNECSHLCLPKPKLSTDAPLLFECACPDGLVLKDMKTCIKPTGPICAVGKFDCFSNGTVCIDKNKVCDETKDCPNSADESVEQCGPIMTEAPNTSISTTQSAPVSAAPKDDSKSNGKIALIVIPVIIVCSILVVLVIYFLMRRYKKKNKNSMNFDNPVYRKTTTDEQLILDKEARANQRLESMQPLNDEPEIV